MRDLVRARATAVRALTKVSGSHCRLSCSGIGGSWRPRLDAGASALACRPALRPSLPADRPPGLHQRRRGRPGAGRSPEGPDRGARAGLDHGARRRGAADDARNFPARRRDLGRRELLSENRSRQEVSFPGSRDGRRTCHEEGIASGEEQIIGILSEAAAGAAAVEVCRWHGISETTFYRWKANFGALAVSDARRLRQLKAENTKLKLLLAEAHVAAGKPKVVVTTAVARGRVGSARQSPPGATTTDRLNSPPGRASRRPNDPRFSTPAPMAGGRPRWGTLRLAMSRFAIDARR